MELSPEESQEMRRVQQFFPYRKITGVKLPSGEFEVFANATYAKANNYARKHGGVAFTFSKG